MHATTTSHAASGDTATADAGAAQGATAAAASRPGSDAHAASSPWPVFWVASIAVFLVSLDSTMLYAAFGALLPS